MPTYRIPPGRWHRPKPRCAAAEGRPLDAPAIAGHPLYGEPTGALKAKPDPADPSRRAVLVGLAAAGMTGGIAVRADGTTAELQFEAEAAAPPPPPIDPLKAGQIGHWVDLKKAVWAVRTADGGVRSHTPRLIMWDGVSRMTYSDADLDRYLDELDVGFGRAFNGLHIPSVAGDWKDRDRAFAVLERVILAVGARGGITHIWAHGDVKGGERPEDVWGGYRTDAERAFWEAWCQRMAATPAIM